MNINYYLLLLFVFLNTTYSQNTFIRSEFYFDIFAGEWHSEKNSSVIIEYWEKISKGTFEGYGKIINKKYGSEELVESLRLVEMLGEIFYIAKVGHNNLPVPFKLTESNDSTLVFENKDHDFPKRIVYSFPSEDKMDIQVGTDENGFTLHFKKIKK